MSDAECFLIEPTDGGPWRRTDTGEERRSPHEFGPGAMWDASWMTPPWAVRSNGDAMNIVVILPNGRVWSVDNRASNCDRPAEDHDCWCRHGTPPNLTVDKQPEPGRSTCSAGAGSILMGDWHGFLRSGGLVVA